MTLEQTMLIVWTRFHAGHQESYETIRPLLILRRMGREAEYQRYYRQVERLAKQLEDPGAVGPHPPR